MSAIVLRILCEWDDEANVWYVAESDVPGLSAEAPTVEAMNALLRVRIPELLELNRPDLCHRGEPVPLEILIQQRQRLRLAC